MNSAEQSSPGAHAARRQAIVQAKIGALSVGSAFGYVTLELELAERVTGWVAQLGSGSPEIAQSAGVELVFTGLFFLAAWMLGAALLLPLFSGVLYGLYRRD